LTAPATVESAVVLRPYSSSQSGRGGPVRLNPSCRVARPGSVRLSPQDTESSHGTEPLARAVSSRTLGPRAGLGCAENTSINATLHTRSLRLSAPAPQRLSASAPQRPAPQRLSASALSVDLLTLPRPPALGDARSSSQVVDRAHVLIAASIEQLRTPPLSAPCSSSSTHRAEPIASAGGNRAHRRQPSGPATRPPGLEATSPAVSAGRLGHIGRVGCDQVVVTPSSASHQLPAARRTRPHTCLRRCAGHRQRCPGPVGSGDASRGRSTARAIATARSRYRVGGAPGVAPVCAPALRNQPLRLRPRDQGVGGHFQL